MTKGLAALLVYASGAGGLFIFGAADPAHDPVVLQALIALLGAGGLGGLVTWLVKKDATASKEREKAQNDRLDALLAAQKTEREKDREADRTERAEQLAKFADERAQVRQEFLARLAAMAEADREARVRHGRRDHTRSGTRCRCRSGFGEVLHRSEHPAGRCPG